MTLEIKYRGFSNWFDEDVHDVLACLCSGGFLDGRRVLAELRMGRVFETQYCFIRRKF